MVSNWPPAWAKVGELPCIPWRSSLSPPRRGFARRERGSSRVSRISRNHQLHPHLHQTHCTHCTHPGAPGTIPRHTTATVGKRDNMGEYRTPPRQQQASEELSDRSSAGRTKRTSPQHKMPVVGPKIPCSTDGQALACWIPRSVLTKSAK